MLRAHTIYTDYVRNANSVPADGGDTGTNGIVAERGRQVRALAGGAVRTECRTGQGWVYRCATVDVE